MIKPYYQEPGITVYNCDCREILPELPKVDLCLTDPPYGITRNKWDMKCRDMVYEVFDKFDKWVCTSQNPFSAYLIYIFRKLFKYSDVWKKTQATGFLNCKVMPLRQHEDILVFGNVKYNPQIKKKPAENIRPLGEGSQSDNYGHIGNLNKKEVRTISNDMTYPTSVLEFPNEQGTNHPTQKPLKLFHYLVLTYTDINDTILDPFMGSGTTLRAAKDLGRKAIGIEIEEKYCEIAVQRLKQQVLEL
jgi:site-specific DNA-methyltransferase (adenine-specific)